MSRKIPPSERIRQLFSGHGILRFSLGDLVSSTYLVVNH